MSQVRLNAKQQQRAKDLVRIARAMYNAIANEEDAEWIHLYERLAVAARRLFDDDILSSDFGLELQEWLVFKHTLLTVSPEQQTLNAKTQTGSYGATPRLVAEQGAYVLKLLEGLERELEIK